MKRTNLLKFVFALAITAFSFSAITAQNNGGVQTKEVQSTIENLQEVNANIADLQAKDPNHPELPNFIEKRDYLQILLEELTTLQGGTLGGSTTKAAPGQKGINPATGKADKSLESNRAGEGQVRSSTGLKAMPAAQPASTLEKLKKELGKLRTVTPQTTAVKAKIRAYEMHIEAVEKADSK